MPVAVASLDTIPPFFTMDSISIRADQPLGVNHSGGYGKAPMSRNFYVAGTCATDVVSGIVSLTSCP